MAPSRQKKLICLKISGQKQEQAKSKEEATKKKEDEKQAFLKWKVPCFCQQAKCRAICLKQCPVGQDILTFTCSKGKCQVDWKKAKVGSFSSNSSSNSSASSLKRKTREKHLQGWL